MARGRPRDVSGRALGARALDTRRRLLDATEELLAGRGARELHVSEIARFCGTSPATFYQYFADVEAAVLELAVRAAEDIPDILQRVEGTWSGRGALDNARSIVDAFIRHWDAHSAVLHLRNLASDAGDRRFQAARRDALSPVLEAIAKRIEEYQASGRVSGALHPHAAAAALLAVLERLAAHHRELERFGVEREDLVETSARILLQVVTGRR